MALQKGITLPSGVTLTYHKIGDCFVDYYAKTTRVGVDSFLSQEVRDGMEVPSLGILNTQDYTFDGIDLSRYDIYAMLKEREEWADATDI